MFLKKVYSHKRILLVVFSLVIVVGLATGLVGNAQAYATPITSIVSINSGVSVTVAGTNFPSGQNFTVRMGPYGSDGVGGTVVGSYNTGSGAYFTSTYAIPSALKGVDKIAIRFESPQGIFSYNWFNNTASTSAPAVPGSPFGPYGYTGYPTFDISSVSAGSSVTILTHNMPVGQVFTVRIGDFGTLGIGGIVVGSTSDSGGSFSATYAIPSALASKPKLAIRLDGPTGYYYAYNWFYNNAAPVIYTPIPGSTSVPPAPPYAPYSGFYGVPTIFISAVARDSTVTVSGNNFPPNQTLNVRMGPYGTLGIGGILVTTQNSGSSGSFSATYSIPGALAGSPKIAIRLETSNGYYNGYNWFYNNSTY
jgi:hypothetical protein